MVTVRLLDVGLLEPGVPRDLYLHRARDGGECAASRGVGQGQDAAAELAPDVDVPVVRRPLGGRECALRNAALNDMTSEDWTTGRKPVPGGIKLNAPSSLAETRCAGGTMRTLSVGGMHVRQVFAPANQP
jgi:hypothetical protein